MLVSIILVTYNSEKFILETLESISNQTYKDIELIISDDCSGDNTVEICRSWLKTYNNRFIRTELLTVPSNTGVAANCNRSLNCAKGEWIKYCAGDDCLLPNCIEDNVLQVSKNHHIKALFSRIELYKNTFDPQNLFDTTPSVPYNSSGILAPGRSAESQYKMLLLMDRIHFTPSVFLHRETLLSIGGFDERFKLLEDHPLWLNLTKNGHKLYLMDNITVRYRQHSNAIHNTGISQLINPNYFKLENFRRVYTYPYLPVDIMLDARFCWCASQIFRLKRFNKNTKSAKLLMTFLTVYLNPFKYFIWIRKRLNKNLINNEFYT